MNPTRRAVSTSPFLSQGLSKSPVSEHLLSQNKPPRCKLYLAIAAHMLISVGISVGALAAPQGGNVTSGTGAISQAGKSTTINQDSQNLAIDWQSFDVAVDERVQFVQPNSQAMALNRILGSNASHIFGQIEANGQVMLVNPHGVYFSETASVNVGSLVASGLAMTPESFLNREFSLEALEGADGTVINHGIINAATGGSVTLVGKSVENQGLITASLGSVNLAAGKEAVLTFDNQGLMGVRVTKEILQEEVGVDAAVLNGGDIEADGGQILLTASTSQAIFSDAVNRGVMEHSRSVVMHDDGSFTLGAGADVVNTGRIDVSSSTADAGQVVVLGENVTHQGEILADGTGPKGVAGFVELHAATTTELTDDAIVSASDTESGKGGDIKLLGENVGLLDQAQVNTSGTAGGGQVLVGGDRTGQNAQVRNADFVYVGEEVQVSANGLDGVDGGKLITFAEDTARIYGQLSATGEGGFIETSGLVGLDVLKAPNFSDGAVWLIDPYDILISDDGDNGGAPAVAGTTIRYESTADSAEIDVSTITTALANVANASVIVQTTDAPGDADMQDGNITIGTTLEYSASNNNTLILNAHNNIDLQAFSVTSSGANLNIQLNADTDSSGSGDVLMDSGSSIITNGGDLTITGQNFTSAGILNVEGRNGGGRTYIDVAGNATVGELFFGDSDNNTANNQLAADMSQIIEAGFDITLNGVVEDGDPEGVTVRQNATGSDAVAAFILRAGDDVAINSSAELELANANIEMIAGASSQRCVTMGCIDNADVSADVTISDDVETTGSVLIHAAGNVNLHDGMGDAKSGFSVPSTVTIKAGDSIIGNGREADNSFRSRRDDINAQSTILLSANNTEITTLATADNQRVVAPATAVNGDITFEHLITSTAGAITLEGRNFTYNEPEGYFEDDGVTPELNGLRTNAQNITLNMTGAINISNAVITNGGDFLVGKTGDERSASPLSFDNFQSDLGGLIDVRSDTGGGKIQIITAIDADDTDDVTVDVANDITLGRIRWGNNNANILGRPTDEDDITVLIDAGDNLVVESRLDVHRTGERIVSLSADDNLTLNVNVFDSDVGNLDSPTLNFNATHGTLTLDSGVSIYSVGGNVSFTGGAFDGTGSTVDTNTRAGDQSLANASVNSGHVTFNMDRDVILGTVTTHIADKW